MQYLDKEDIVSFNKRTIDKHGGNFVPPFNFLKETALDYLIEVVEHGVLFGEAMYPTIVDKAALYLYNICQNHVFSDGNKRTALNAMDTFIRLNGYSLKQKLEVCILDNKEIPTISEESRNRNAILFELVMQVADGKISYEEVVFWLNHNIYKAS